MKNFSHDCSTCVYLGEFVREKEYFDLYFCHQGSKNSPTLLARFSDAGPDYLSGLIFGKMDQDDPDSPLGEAYRRARSKDLVK